MFDFTQANKIAINVFGEAVLIDTPAGEVALQAIVEKQSTAAGVNSASYTDENYSLSMLAETVAAAGLNLRDKITVRGVVYQIADITYDVIGMSALRIRRG